MVLMADEEDVEVLGGEPLGLVVHLGDQRAGGVDGPQVAALGLLADLGRYPVGGKDQDRALGHALRFIDEDRAARLKLTDHMGVVDDLLTHVDGGTVALEGHLDGLHGPVHPGTVTAGLGEQYASGSRGHVPYGS